MKTTYGFSRRGPDRVAEELAAVLSKKASFEFKALFDIVHANLRERNQAGGGEEMLRLRAYEKLQNLVRAGIVKKTGKEYRGDTAGLASFLEASAELNAKFAATVLARTPAAAPKNVPPPKIAPTPKKAAAPKKAAVPKSAAVPKKVPALKKAPAPKKAPAAKKAAAPKRAPTAKLARRSR